ncbi:MAG: transglycosylase domain-containing protein, partial [Gammaproteobacteria bacterium]|nr:transglycosylase domain-containing protein [Gammaproteobacteria bacterium]
MPKRPSNSVSKKSRLDKSWLRFIKPLFIAATAMACFLFAYTLYLDIQIRNQFEGKRWSLPAKVYARPLEIYPGKSLLKNELLAELSNLQYFPQTDAAVAGSYEDNGNELILHTRPFRYWDGEEWQQRILIRFSGQHIHSIENLTDELPRDLIRLDPVRIATIYPSHKEDRALLRLNQVPQKLIEALISIEDRDFYNHNGISFRSIARAMLANLKAGRTVQGGSTLTQQLVKNYFLSNEQTLTRKLNEAIMAWLLDFHYPKDEILEAYFNEIYLGQDGSRAIHGVGMASQYYFGRNPLELGLEHQALLIAILNGPSYYNPRRFPERAIEKRNLILKVMLEHGLITPNQAEQSMTKPLGVLPQPKSSINRH